MKSLYTQNSQHIYCIFLETRTTLLWYAFSLHFFHNHILVHEGGCPAEQDTTCSNLSSVTWPVTPVGSVATVSCPCGVSDPMIQQLMATRRCRAGTNGSYGVWEEPQCDSCMFSQTTLALCELTDVST